MKALFLLWLLSPFGLWSIARKQSLPCDESNRFNKIILIWFAFTRYHDIKYASGFDVSRFDMIKRATFHEELFAPVFLWLKLDAWEFLQGDL